MISVVLFPHPGSVPPQNHVRSTKSSPMPHNNRFPCSVHLYFRLGEHCVGEEVWFSLSSRVRGRGLQRQDTTAHCAPSDSVSKSELSNRKLYPI